MPEPTVPPPCDGDPRFNVHLLADIDRVLQGHGSSASNGGQLAELQLHLFHFLHGDNESDHAGTGTSFTVPPPASMPTRW